MSLALSIGAFLDTTGMTEAEVKLELALIAYRNQRLTFNQAREFADVEDIQFMHFLKGRDVALHYDADDLSNDLQTADKLSQVL